jgi:hypothetical protein
LGVRYWLLNVKNDLLIVTFATGIGQYFSRTGLAGYGSILLGARKFDRPKNL